jgi:hypothetical protein
MLPKREHALTGVQRGNAWIGGIDPEMVIHKARGATPKAAARSAWAQFILTGL